MVSTVPCDLVIYLYVTGFMVCLLDCRLCCLKVNVYWTLTDERIINHKMIKYNSGNLKIIKKKINPLMGN